MDICSNKSRVNQAQQRRVKETEGMCVTTSVFNSCTGCCNRRLLDLVKEIISLNLGFLLFLWNSHYFQFVFSLQPWKSFQLFPLLFSLTEVLCDKTEQFYFHSLIAEQQKWFQVDERRNQLGGYSLIAIWFILDLLCGCLLISFSSLFSREVCVLIRHKL